MGGSIEPGASSPANQALRLSEPLSVAKVGTPLLFETKNIDELIINLGQGFVLKRLNFFHFF
jgi:hypothetical protein